MTARRLPIVPDWLGDETLYSWAARAHRQGGASVKQTSHELFGATHAYREHCAPAGLHHFVSATGHLLGGTSDLLLGRTALSAYYPFLSGVQRERFAELASTGVNVAWSSLFGMRSSGLAVNNLRWCPQCVEADRERWGAARWRLPHQLPGVRICCDHDELLREHDAVQAAWHLPPRIDRAVHGVKPLASSQMRALRTVAALSTSLVGGVQLDLVAMTEALTVVLRSQSVLPAGKTSSVDRLQTWFASTAVAEAIRDQPGLEVLADGAWLHDAVHGRRAAHPVKWLLLWAATFADRGETVAVRLLHDPAGATVWDPAGQGLLWPEADPNVDPRLKTAMETHQTAGAVAKSLGVSLTAVRRYLRSAGRKGQEARAAIRKQARLDLAVQEIGTFMVANPACTRSQVRLLCKTQVSWLRRCAPDALTSLLARLPQTRGRPRAAG
ncbi:MAG: hypothetical protein EON59_03120 [Alphaproteobacteria bacterium]|nr:MAG: hypothetical protein EON59_03120 [Alphaproteobacteria bacterium]